jgi:TatD DNase family protein
MTLIDTHCHLHSFMRAGTLEDTLARARAAGVAQVITVGTSMKDWADYRDLVSRNPGYAHYTAGLHPCDVDAHWAAQVGELEAYWRGVDGPVPVALGECGLDGFHLPKDPVEAEALFSLQRAAFAAQLELAKNLRCPVVVHSRGAFDACVELVDRSGVDWSKVVFHCFTEDAVAWEKLGCRGGRGSWTGIVSYKTAETVREGLRAAGLAGAMLETDAPYLAPVPHRGKPNEPAYLRHTADAVAGVFAVTPEQVAEITTRNARAFYGI